MVTKDHELTIKTLTLEYLRDDLQDALDSCEYDMRSKIAQTIRDINKALGKDSANGN